MANLVSGMILLEKTYGDLHYLITTPFGWKVIDTCGACMEFDKESYERAYIPINYDDVWTPIENTIVEFK